MLSKGFLFISFLCSLIALILSSIAMISANTDGAVMASLYWGYLHTKSDHSSDVDIQDYVGVFGIYYDGTVYGTTYRGTFMYDGDCNVNYCRTCINSMSVVIGFLAICVFISLFSVGFNITRLWGFNSLLIKVLGAISSTLAIIMGLISLIVFATTCMATYVKEVSYNSTHAYGPAFALLATSVSLLFVEFIFNLLIDVGSQSDPKIFECCSCCGSSSSIAAAPLPAYQQQQPQLQMFAIQPVGVQYGQLPQQGGYVHPQADKPAL